MKNNPLNPFLPDVHLLNILSLFDGISCGRIALERAGIKIDKYFSSEIDKYAMQIAKKNYPDIVHIGSVTDIGYSDGKLLLSGGQESRTRIDMIIGGSPCQDLSIAKKDGKGLQGEKSGLFFEYVRLLKEVKPKYFLLENVASMKKADKEEITRILTEIYPDTQCYLINSALVSAQNRKRLYWTNIQGVEQPMDKGILLKDILEKTVDEKYITHMDFTNRIDYTIHNSPYEGKGQGLRATDYKGTHNMIRVGQFNTGGQGDRVYSPEGKSVSLSANGGGRGAKTGLYEVGGVALRNRGEGKKPEFNGTEKANSMTTVQTDSMVAITPRIGQPQPYPRNYNELGLPRTEVLEFRDDNKTNSVITNPMKNVLDDGAVIRKLTPIECERLQTLPDNYTEGISNTQRYKAIGNGWTVDVIAHIFSYLK